MNNLRIIWVRGSENIGFNRPHTWFVLGVRGSGKSSFLEHVGECYLNEGHTILDLFGSRDGEGLAWLRSPYAKEKRILLIHGDNVDVQCSFDTKNVSKVQLGDFERYDILISSSPLYSSPDDEFFHVNRLIDLLYKRLSWKHLVYMIVREAANLYYSRLRISDNQLAAKAESTYLIREARHVGVAVGLDTLKYTSIDVDIRSVLDYLILKSQGSLGLPSSLQWLYGFFDPSKVRNMPPKYFLMLTRKGAIGVGRFPKIEWHKQEKENILRSLGIKVEYGEQIDYGKSRGAFKTVGDFEHAEIISLYMQGLSMKQIAQKLDRSAATIHAQIHAHNQSIERLGYCMKCKRVKGEHANQKIDKKAKIYSFIAGQHSTHT